jgi:hypothetical protein
VESEIIRAVDEMVAIRAGSGDGVGACVCVVEEGSGVFEDAEAGPVDDDRVAGVVELGGEAAGEIRR